MKKSLVIYYIFLLGVLSTWNSPNLPPLMYRLVFLVLAIAPIVYVNNKLFPCVLSMLVMISANRHVPSYMPFLPMYLAITTLLALLVRNYKSAVKPPVLLVTLMLYTCFVDFSRTLSIESITITVLIVVMFFLFVDSDVESLSRVISLSFVVISAFLCIETFVFREEFSYLLTVGANDFERVGWNDPNYFSGIIGMGAIAAINLLLLPERLSKWTRLLLIAIIMLVILVSLITASRGGIIALFVSGIVLFVLSRRKSKTSTGLLLLLVAFVIVLYQTGAFEFLISRFTEDEGEIGGRRIIWVSKLKDFSAQASILDWLIGIGHRGGLYMSSYVGNRNYIGFHNDFIAFLVSYGLIGFLIVVTLLLTPIIKYKDPCVTAGCLYIILISMSLEPLYSGALDIYYFYFYVCILGESTKKQVMLPCMISKSWG